MISIVFESDEALFDSTFLERYISEKVSGIESVRTARLSKSRVVFELAFRGNPGVLAGRLASGWAPFQVESTLEGENTIKLKRSNGYRPSGNTGCRPGEDPE
ncbi:MAG TPA: hypothetical protein ENN79_05030 [Desulfobacteraceae bacterium]|nr:hypothetical protein [Desulfobacteraceae bacterium]